MQFLLNIKCTFNKSIQTAKSKDHTASNDKTGLDAWMKAALFHVTNKSFYRNQ